MGGRRHERGFVWRCDISRYVSDLGISFVQARLGDSRHWERRQLARVTAALGGTDLASVIRSHNGDERDRYILILLDHSVLVSPFEVQIICQSSPGR